MSVEKINQKPLRYFDVIVGLFVAVLIVSNIASTKLVAIHNLIFDGGTILFPLAYIFGDILTEVYGYAKARRVIWIGFFCLFLTSLTLLIVQYLPAASGWDDQTSYVKILGFLPRIAIASLIAYLLGEFINSYVLAKLKIKTAGKYLWIRTIGSTILGEGADTVTFTVIAFAGKLSGTDLINLITTVYFMKVGIEVVCTPITYWVVGFLKRKENVDVYDTNTDFTPIKIAK